MDQMEEAGPATYAWDNAWVEARRRLDLLEQCWDPQSHARLRDAGVGAGWSCLEVGGGGGSIVRWLCDEVGPDGSVVTVDIDTRFLDVIGAPNLEVIQADVVTDGLPEGSFDLIHTRAVLLHIPARDRLLPELVARLRPGGTIVLEEPDLYSFGAAESPLYRDVWRQFGEIMHRTVGTHPAWGRGLAARCAGLGLTEVRSHVSTSIFPGGSPEAEFYRLTFLQARDLLLANGIDTVDFDEFLSLLDDDTQWFPGPAIVMATGRRPG
jgi:SAM-dependent methyltransferase